MLTHGFTAGTDFTYSCFIASLGESAFCYVRPYFRMKFTFMLPDVVTGKSLFFFLQPNSQHGSHRKNDQRERERMSCIPQR